MATLTIRNFDENLKANLRLKAAQSGHSMEEEARLILRQALSKKPKQTSVARRIRQRMERIGGVELELPARSDKPRAPKLK